MSRSTTGARSEATGGATTTRLLLARHGQVDANWHGRLYGGLDVPLAPEGEAQSRELARRLADVELDRVVSSDLARAAFAADLLREPRGLAAVREPDLRELSRGDWAGLTFDELERREPGAWAAWSAEPGQRRPPGGESLDDLAARVLPCLDRLACETPGGTLAIVAHSWVVRVAACAALDLDNDAARSLYLPMAGLVQIDWPCAAGWRPTLGGFALDRLPSPLSNWYRGPRGDGPPPASR